MKNLVTLVLSVAISLVAFSFLMKTPPPAAPQASADPVFGRVMDTNTIRCGYVVWPPFIIKDPNTGTISGIFHDYAEAMGEALSMKIEWSTELNLDTYLDDLNAQKYDVECSGGWPSAARGKKGIYTDPIYYLAMVTFVRADDTRFQNDILALNNPGVTFVIRDGEYGFKIKDRVFPQAKLMTLPVTSPAGADFEAVATGKADVVMATNMFGYTYMKNNPGKLKPVFEERPLQLFAQNMTLKPGEDRLRHMLNTASEELLLNGTVEAILKKYEERPYSFYRVQKPYRLPGD